MDTSVESVTPSTVHLLHHPEGYPRIGLAPLALNLASTSSAAVTRRLEALERATSTSHFRAHGFEAHHPRVASELANVYAALRQWYPNVFADKLNVAWTPNADKPGYTDALGLTYSRDELLAVRDLAYRLDEPNVARALARAHEVDDPDLERAARRELARERRLDPRHYYTLLQLDARAPGHLTINEHLSHPHCLSEWENYERSMAGRRNAHGAPHAEGMARHTTLITTVLVHEFMHLVDVRLIELGPEAVAHFWSVADDVLLRDERSRRVFGPARLRAAGLRREDVRLVNYPMPKRGAADGLAPAALVRREVGRQVALTLGTYAPSGRPEIFAEALMLAFVSADPALRRRLFPLRRTLREFGIETAHRRPL